MMAMRWLGLAAALLVTFGLAAAAEEARAPVPAVTAGTLTIENPRSRASVGTNGVAYMTLRNMADTEDRLIAVRGDVAKAIELHMMKHDDGVMKMRPVEGGVAVPAKGEVALAPGGLHVMLIGLQMPLKEGDTFPLTLIFEKAGEVTVEVTVGAIEGDAGHGH